MTIIQKGYGDVKLDTGEVVQGEITLYSEAWISVTPVPPAEKGELRWFPRERVSEVVWRKSVAVRRAPA
ncbi:MAG: hypothetical protein ACE149_18700 [Armatimonadota bacterium]